MDKISEKFQEIVTAQIMVDNNVVMVDYREANYPLSVNPDKRIRKNPHRMASGKLLLAYQSLEFQTQYVQDRDPSQQKEGFSTFTEELLEEFRNVKKQGYCELINVGDNGIVAYAVPVFDVAGYIAISIACSAPVIRVTNKLGEEIRNYLLVSAKEMSAKLGCIKDTKVRCKR